MCEVVEMSLTGALVLSSDSVVEEESLLSRTFQRGFAAGEAVSSHEITQLLPAILDDFKSRHANNIEAKRWATAFASFLRQRVQNRARDLNLAYLAEGAGI